MHSADYIAKCRQQLTSVFTSNVNNTDLFLCLFVSFVCSNFSVFVVVNVRESA